MSPTLCCDRVELPQIETFSVRRLSVSDEQQLMTALSACRNPYMLPVVQLALLTGLRRSELLRLEWGDVDWQESVLSVRQSKSGYPR